MASQTKTCRRCGESKPLADFKTNTLCVGGRRHFCRACMILPPTTLLERLLLKVEGGSSADGCWLWQGARNSSGYGLIQAGRRSAAGHKSPDLAHRVAYELLVGPIPAGLDLDHLCRTPACVNPAHLEPVTRSENLRRGYAARMQQVAV